MDSVLKSCGDILIIEVSEARIFMSLDMGSVNDTVVVPVLESNLGEEYDLL